MLTNQIAELAAVVRDQMAEIDRLRADNGRLRTENDRLDKLRAENKRLLGWIMGDEPDALAELQKVYSDPKTTENNKLKALGIAIHFERARPPSSSVAVVVDFREKVKTIRLAQLERDKARWAAEDAAKTIEHQPLDLDTPTSPTILGGDDSAA